MDFPTIITPIISSLGITSAGTYLLGKDWVKYRFDLELERKKLDWAAEIRKEVENDLADSATDRQYKMAAKQRLYSATGTLRFQLLVACRDVSNHIKSHGLYNYTWSLSPTNYYGQSTLYRILRPLTIFELIERQIAFADFSVDPTAVDLLRYQQSAYRSFTSNKAVSNHPDEDWEEETEHVYRHSITTAANALIVKSENEGSRPMFFHEFKDFLSDTRNHAAVSPFLPILQDFTIQNKPIFWIRLVCYAYVCSSLVNTLGVSLGFRKIELELEKLLNLSPDDFTHSNLNLFCDNFKQIANSLL